MKCRIMIEDENGLYQAEMEKDESILEVTQNLRNLLNMKKIGTYIILTDCANFNGCRCSIKGNAETIAQQYDALTHFIINKVPHILMRVISAWNERIWNERMRQ